MIFSLIFIATLASASLLPDHRQDPSSGNFGQGNVRTSSNVGFGSSASTSAFSPTNSVSVVSASSSGAGVQNLASYLPPAALTNDDYNRRFESVQNGVSYTVVRSPNAESTSSNSYVGYSTPVSAVRNEPALIGHSYGSKIADGNNFGTRIEQTQSVKDSYAVYKPSVKFDENSQIRTNYEIPSPSGNVVRQNLAPDDLMMLAMSIPGQPNLDYPIYAEIPRTPFNCDGRHEGGYYADVDARCQVFHVCALKQNFSFLCPNGTIFDQMNFVCNWWFNVDCPSSPNFFALNNLIGVTPSTTPKSFSAPSFQAQVLDTALTPPSPAYLPPRQVSSSAY